MRISEALELAGQSLDSLMVKLKELNVKELFELVNDLRFSNNHEEMERLEKNSTHRGLDILRRFTHEKIGITTGPDTLPSIALRKYLDEIRSWTV